MHDVTCWLGAIGAWLESHGSAITALATVVIAWFTVALALSTKKLGRMSVKQDARMRESIRISKNATKLSEASLIAGERAFVFTGPIGFQYRPASPVENRYWFQLTWDNSGDTPTKRLRTHIRFDLRDTPLPQDFDFRYETNEFAPAVIAPKSRMLSPIVPLAGVTPGDLLAVHQGAKFAYIWGWVKYFDVFPNTPEHITRFCYRIVVNGDPLSPGTDAKGVDFMYPLHPRNNCADEECAQAGA